MESLEFDNSLQGEVDAIIKSTSALREVTYKYVTIGEVHFNETIFVDYLSSLPALSNPKKLKLYLRDSGFLERMKHKANSKLNNNINTLEAYKNSDECSDSANIDMLITALRFTQNGLDFELEAAGHESGLTDQEIEEKTKQQEEYDEILFGEHVSKSPEFLLESYAYTKHHLDNCGDKLGEDKKHTLRKGLERMLEEVSDITGDSIDDIEIPEYIEPKKDPEFEKLTQIKISREDYERLFNISFEIAGVRQRSQLGNYGGFYDGDDSYGIPTKKDYEYKTLEELLRLIPHETHHYVSLKETEKRGNGKQPGDIINDEGAAMYTESLVSGVDTENSSYMTFAGPSVVMNRLLDGSEYLGFQDAYLELLEANAVSTKGDVIGKSLRKKRGFHKSYRGGTNKDAAYPIGLKSVYEFMRGENGSVQNLYGGKLSVEQMKSGEYLPRNFGNSYINHILFSELIFFYAKNDFKIDSGELGLHETFVAYMKDKYKNLASQFDFFKETEKFVYANKKKVVEALQIVKRSANQMPSNDNSPEPERIAA